MKPRQWQRDANEHIKRLITGPGPSERMNVLLDISLEYFCLLRNQHVVDYIVRTDVSLGGKVKKLLFYLNVPLSFNKNGG